MSRADVLAALADAVLRTPAPRPVRVGIDGRSAAGKTTLAGELAQRLESLGRSCARLSIDDFHPPGYVQRAIAGDFTPQSYPYEGYDLEAFRRALCEPRDGILVVEAAYLFLPELCDCFELTIWLEIDFDTMLARAEKRDVAWLGSAARVRERYEKYWIPRHRCYEEAQRPRDRAHIVVDNGDLENPRIVRIRP
jgi:uridine kinase